jgi:hypothetical protein
MWLQESIKRGNNLKDHYTMEGVDIIIKDALPEGVSASFVFDYISTRVPFYLMNNIDIIYVGLFPEMKERDINAYYENDAIFVTCEQEDEMDMIEDIVHEISHAVEHYNQEFIYGDGSLQREFLAKRQRLESLLSQKYDVPSNFGVDFEFDKSIDNFLFRDVGYDVLNQVCVNIFPSGYAATSVSEYWAIGFEEMFLNDTGNLKQECPVLYKKLVRLVKELSENT